MHTQLDHAKKSDTYSTKLPCHRCGVFDYHRIEPGMPPHGNKLMCITCDAFIRWLPKNSPEQREFNKQAGIRAWMAIQPPSAKQIRYLKRMAHKGAKPASKLEAHDAIEAMKNARGWS